MPFLISLIGYRASGKTTLGRILANSLQYDWYDTDSLLKGKIGEDFSKWILRFGWEKFRAIEKETLLSLLHLQIKNRRPAVISTGGGIICDPENRSLLKAYSKVIYLKAAPPILSRRMEHDPASESQRPSLTKLDSLEEIILVLKERELWYQKTAHYCIDTSHLSLKACKAQILDWLKQGQNNPCH